MEFGVDQTGIAKPIAGANQYANEHCSHAVEWINQRYLQFAHVCTALQYKHIYFTLSFFHATKRNAAGIYASPKMQFFVWRLLMPIKFAHKPLIIIEIFQHVRGSVYYRVMVDGRPPIYIYI